MPLVDSFMEDERSHRQNLGDAINILDLRSGWIMAFAAAVTMPAGSTQYLGTSHLSATENDVTLEVCNVTVGIARNLRIFYPSTPGVGQTVTATLLVSNADTALSAVLSGGSSNANDNVNTAAFGSGDRLTVKIVTSAGANVSFVTVAIELTRTNF